MANANNTLMQMEEKFFNIADQTFNNILAASKMSIPNLHLQPQKESNSIHLVKRMRIQQEEFNSQVNRAEDKN